MEGEDWERGLGGCDFGLEMGRSMRVLWLGGLTVERGGGREAESAQDGRCCTLGLAN